MTLALIAAVDRSLGIGKDGKLPWHISEDLKRFKRLTTGHAVLMGRKTFESLGKPLPERRNVVLTSRSIPGVETYRSIPEAFKALANEQIVFAIGGGQVYAALLEFADRLHLTLVDQNTNADTFFPPFESLVDVRFKLVNSEPHTGFIFLDYERIPLP